MKHWTAGWRGSWFIGGTRVTSESDRLLCGCPTLCSKPHISRAARFRGAALKAARWFIIRCEPLGFWGGGFTPSSNCGASVASTRPLSVPPLRVRAHLELTGREQTAAGICSWKLAADNTILGASTCMLLGTGFGLRFPILDSLLPSSILPSLCCCPVGMPAVGDGLLDRASAAVPRMVDEARTITT